MSKINIKQGERKIFSILCLVVIIKLAESACPYPYERCICSGGTPACPCSQITSTGTINSSNTYYSHLVLVSSVNPSSNYGCRPCPPRCLKCSATEICSQCFVEFELINNTYCVPCPINCQTCKSGVCQTCNNGYYIDNQLNCQLCPQVGTKTCSIDSLSSCLPNYWMDNNGATCVNCNVNCLTCSSTTKCSTCMNGYYQLNYACYACRSDCATCTNASTCVTCLNSKYYFSSTAGSCVQCPTANCTACTSNGTCTQCDSINNFYLNKTTKLCYQYTNSTPIPNCLNLTYTASGSLYACQFCQDGYYSLSTYSGSNSLTCYYGCSIVCSRCTGPHYGLCNACISSDFTLFNLHCIPNYNTNSGSTFQLLYTALNNVSFFQASTLIPPDSCWHEHVKGGSSTITFRLLNMAVYKFTIMWKIYKYSFFNTSATDGNYSLQINNSLIQTSSISQSYTFTSFTCGNKVGFSTLCTSGSIYQCTDKNTIDFDTLVTSTDNVFTFSSSNSLVAMSELFVIGYRCGGIYGGGCIQCTDINTCTKCTNPSYYLIAETCIAQCPNNYYTFMEHMKCVKVCPSGSYSDDVLHQCFSCQSPCKTCTSNTVCLTCVAGYYYNSQSGLCQSSCPKMYYPDSYRRICEQCSNPCLECLDSVSCISCREGFLNVNSSSNSSVVQYGECVLQCPNGMFTDLVTMKCQSCLTPCSACSLLSTQCTTCIQNYYLLNSNCLSSCPQGYFNNLTSQICSLCDFNCQNCLNLTYCVQCQVGFYLNFDNTCVTSCASGYYQQQILKQCLKCKNNCSTCNSYDVCTSCVTGFYYLEDNYSCIVNCPRFYYSTSISSSNSSVNVSICQRCQLPCYQCSSQSFCLSCYDAFLFNGSCMIVCPSGYFANLDNLQCLLCDNNSCLQCKNTPTQCTACHSNLLLVNGNCLTSCPSGFYFSAYNSSCIPCQGLCVTCTNSTYCLSCVQGFSLWQSGQCMNSCQPGYYQPLNVSSNQLICTLCPIQCETCVYNNTLQAVLCLLCSPGYAFYVGSCLDKCPDGYYNNSGQCIACVSPCLTCQDQQYCLSCINGYGFLYKGNFFILFKGICVTSCPYGYYPSQNTCISCDQSCLICTDSATNCQACTGSLFMYSYYLTNISMGQSVCSNQCPSGYFMDQSSSNYDNMCQKCSQNCKTCTGSIDNCTSCISGLILYGNQCVSQCPINTYFNSTSNTCIQCSSNCLYCLNIATCIQCQGQYLLNSNNTCTNSCDLSEYGEDGICKPCVYPCKTCTNENLCLSCIVGIYYVNESSCMDTCPQGSFYVKQNTTDYCQSCKVNCSSCVSENECLFCNYGLQLYIGSCLQQCPDGYYGNYGICVQCDQNCMICLNSYTCLTCGNGSYMFNNKCISYCPVGYFATNLTVAQTNSSASLVNTNTTQPSCLPCATQCTNCYNSATQCTQCASGYYLYVNECLLTCPNGSYPSAALMSCQPCVSPCQTCTNAYSCVSCIYGYLLYREYSKNQCVQGPSCPNNYYLDTDLNICEFICPQNYYVSQSTKTCSLTCPNNLVTLISNKSCLEYCPTSMWIDENLYCQPSSSQPSNLPYLNCTSFILRNLLFLSCSITNPVNNLATLNVQNIDISVGQASLVKIKDNSTFYVLVSWIDKILRNEQISLGLINKYELKSSVSKSVQASAVSKTAQNDLLQSASNSQQSLIPTTSSSSSIQYPVQNYKVQILISQFIPYSVNQRSIGMSFYQIAQSISYAGLIIWLFCLLKNVKIVSLVLLMTMQWLYSLSMLLSGNFLAPNANQFLQGFKYSGLIDLIGIWSTKNDSTKIWSINTFIKPQYWAINNLYSLEQALVIVYALIGVFLFIYFLTLALAKGFSEAYINPQHETLLKIGKKSLLLNDRFYTNYFFHILLFTISPISLMVNIQLTQPNIQGLIQSIGLFVVYIVFISISVYFFVKWRSQNIKKNTRKSMIFLYMHLGTTSINSVFIIWGTFYLFVGFTVASILLNMIVWHMVYRETESKRCSYLQLIELFKGFILIVLIICDIKRQSWSQDEMFYFGFVQIVVIFLYILLSSVFIAQELFRPQHPLTKKQEKPLQQSLLKDISFKTSNYPKHYQSKENQQNSLSSVQKQQNMQQQEEDEELSFFSYRTPLSESDDSSEGDIIDFDESQVQNRNSPSHQHVNVPPKNLFKYDKNA